jgi:adenosylhomocysteine nucleosidase
VSPPTFLVGFAAEAAIARLSGWPVAIAGGTIEGAIEAARRLIAARPSGVISFGLAAGLDPALPAGTLVVADAIDADNRRLLTDPALSARLGGSTGHLCLGVGHVLMTAAEKQSLGKLTGAAIADMESGALATAAAAAGVPFAVLRAICDPAGRDLPPAALVALGAGGRIEPARIAWSLLTRPGQIGALIGLARDAAVARRALRRHLSTIAGRVANL